MSVFTYGSWARGCKHVIVLDDKSVLPKRDGRDVATELFRMSYNKFCDILQEMVDCKEINQDRADDIYIAYAIKNEEREVLHESL